MNKKFKGIGIDLLLAVSYAWLTLAILSIFFYDSSLKYVSCLILIVNSIICWGTVIFSVMGKNTLGHRIANKKDNKKEITFCIVFAIFSALLYVWNMFFNPVHEFPDITLKENLIVQQYSEITNLYGIENISKGKIITKEKIIDTSELGKKEILIEIENNYGIKREYIYFLEIVKEKKICEISFRNINDDLLMGKEVLKKSGASIDEDSTGNKALKLTIEDKDKFFEVTNRLSKQENNNIVIWINFDEDLNSYSEEGYLCGSGESNCLSSAVVTNGFSSDIIIPGNSSQEIVECINNSLG